MKQSRQITALLAIVLILIAIISIAESFESEFKYPDKILNIIEDTHEIKITVHHKIGESEEKIIKRGISPYLGDGYFLALTHVISQDPIQIINSAFGRMRRQLDITGYDYIIDDKYPVTLIGSYDDISLFKLDEYPKKETSYRFGDSDLLRVGDKAIMIGNSLMYGINLKTGIVSNLGYNYNVQASGKVNSFDTRISFLISNPTNSGDSGSALLAKEGDDYYIIGIVHGYIMYGEAMGCAFRSNYVKGVLKILTQDIGFLD